MSKTDPGWIIIIVIAAIIAVIWKPMIMPVVHRVSGTWSNKDAVERGRVIFKDTTRWAVEGASCASCHEQDGPVPTGKGARSFMVNFTDLTGVYLKYRKGVMATDEPLAEQINKCITQGDRLESPSLSTTNPTMQDLIAYLQKH